MTRICTQAIIDPRLLRRVAKFPFVFDSTGPRTTLLCVAIDSSCPGYGLGVRDNVGGLAYLHAREFSMHLRQGRIQRCILELHPVSEQTQRHFQAKNGFAVDEKHFKIAYRTIVYTILQLLTTPTDWSPSTRYLEDGFGL